jgi:hypothetical protein
MVKLLNWLKRQYCQAKAETTHTLPSEVFSSCDKEAVDDLALRMRARGLSVEVVYDGHGGWKVYTDFHHYMEARMALLTAVVYRVQRRRAS